MLGCSNRIRGGRIDHEAAMLGGGGEIHIVDPDPSAPDHPELATGGLENISADLGAAPHDKGIAERDLGAELLGGEVIGAVNVGQALEKGQPGLAELLGDKDPGFGVRAAGLDGHSHDSRAAVWEEGGSGEARRDEEAAGEGGGVVNAEGGGGEAVGGGQGGRHFE